MGRVQKDEPYSSVTSSGSTSPRKWPLKSSCRQEARTDSCSESKSSWVVRRGETVIAQTQPHCPHYPELLNSSAWGARISRPLPQQKGPFQRRGRGNQLPAGLWAGLLPPHLQDLVHDFLHDLTLGLCVATEQKGEEVSGTQRRAERRTHTQHTRVHRDKTKALCGEPGCGGGLGAEPAAPWAVAKEKGNPHSTASPLLFRNSSTQNLGERAWRAGKQGCPSQPTPQNLNRRRPLLCPFSHLSTRPRQNPSTPTSLHPPSARQTPRAGTHLPFWSWSTLSLRDSSSWSR